MMFMCVRALLHIIACVWESGEKFILSFLSFYFYMGSGVEQMSSFFGKHPYWLSHWKACYYLYS